MVARALAGAALLALLLVSVPVHAEDARSYDYKLFRTEYYVHPDSTIEVREHLTYHFNGEYHKGFRSIATKGADSITDVRLTDDQERPLRKTSGDLDKLDPSSWGAYTVSHAPGSVDVAWYFDANNTDQTWILTYTLHGGVSFLKDHDELYWNIFTSLDAPVETAEADVILPKAVTTPQTQWYVNGDHTTTINQPDEQIVIFTANNFQAGEPATFAIGWPKGLVDENAYWREWWASHWPYIASGVILLITAIFCSLYWFFTEVFPRIGRVIVAEYEPPQGLPPAIASLVKDEHVSSKTWAATVVDLAVRGYVKISEDPPTSLDKINFGVSVVSLLFLGVLFVGGFAYLAFSASAASLLHLFVTIWLPLLIPLLIIAFFIRNKLLRLGRLPKDYLVERLNGTDDSLLRPYESEFLLTLLSMPGPFSTKALRTSSTDAQIMYLNMKKLEKSLRAETDRDTGAYERTLAHEQHGLMIVGFTIVAVIFGTIFLGSLANFGLIILGGVIALSSSVITYFIKYEARLNPDGQKLKDQILGFKLYLETAERYRMQNLTPETFEKYLPYAIIFGVEKKWAKAFEGITLPPPTWYSGAYVGSSIGGNSSPSFSATAFTAGFSASFASAFASSGASGGASGGGGSAGGGGGGGGGGAS